MRTVLLGVPPTLPALHRALGLSYSAAGLLTAMPVLILALGAIPGAFLVNRVGARRAVTYGLAFVTLGTALRGALPVAVTLFFFTAVLALGIAITQPAMPALVEVWFPRQIARASALYSNGLLVGEVIAATITLPLLLGALQLSWQGALSAWALPAAVCLGLWLAVVPRFGRLAAPPPAGDWFPDLRSGRMWRIGLLMGGTSLVYFGMNSWIPDTLEVRGGHQLIALSLGLLNFMQLPVSAGLAVAGDWLLGRRWPYVLAGLLSLLGVAGYVAGPLSTAPLWAGLMGAAASLVFILNLGLPAVLSPGEVARFSGFMFTVGYGCAFFGPALGGFAWDLTGRPAFAVLPMGVASVAIVALGASLPQVRRAAGGVSSRVV